MLKPGSEQAKTPPEEAPPGALPGAEDGLFAEVRDVLGHLRHRTRAIVLAALLMALVGAVVASLLPRLYTSTAQILVDPRGLRVFDNEVVPGGQLSDVQSALVESQTRVLKSDSILRPVVAQENLGDDPEFNGSPQTIAGKIAAVIKHAFLGGSPADPTDIALNQLGDAVKVQRVPNSFVLELAVSSKDAAKAARLAQAITDAFIAQAEQSREGSAKRVSEGLALRLDALGGEVKRAETAVDTFKRENHIVDTNGRPVNEQQLGDLTNQLVSARVRTAELRSRVEQVQRVQKAGIVPEATNEMIQSNAITALRNRYAEVTQLRDNLLTSLGPRHPNLIAADAQLAGVRQLINQEVARIAASARSDYERAQATEAGLGQAVASATTDTGAVNTATIRLRELEREAAARRAVYESFLTRSRETREQGDLPSVNIAVISPAAVPLKAGGLPAPLVVAIVAAFGATAAAMLAVGLDNLAGRIVTTRQMSLVTGLPLLAVVRRRSRGGLFGRRKPTVADVAPASLRLLQGAIADATPSRPPRIVLLISATRVVADVRLPLALAEAAAQEGERVLLIDADDDRLTRPFDTSAGSEHRGWTALRPTPIANLSVLAWSAPFIGATPADGRGGAGALRHFALDHDLILVHGTLADETVRLRPLAAVATTIALLADADAASLGQIDVVRAMLGPEGAKVAGFAWVTRDRTTTVDTRPGSGALGQPSQQPAMDRVSASRSSAA